MVVARLLTVEATSMPDVRLSIPTDVAFWNVDVRHVTERICPDTEELPPRLNQFLVVALFGGATGFKI